MATTQKKVGTTRKSALKKATKKAPKKKVGGTKRRIAEERIQIPLNGGRFVDIRVTVASTPKVGPGPRPSLAEMLLVKRIDESQVLTISTELARRPTAGVVVGPGGPPKKNSGVVVGPGKRRKVGN